MENAVPLWAHQQKAIDIATNRFALFFDPGTGKSRTAIELFKKSEKKRKAIILAPLNVCRNWEKELRLYLEREYTVHLVAGQTAPKKLKTLQQFKESICSRGDHFLICNIEALRSKAYSTALEESGATFLIVDESHNFKSPNSLQTKALLKLSERLPLTHLYLLTGTPAPQGDIDLWSTFRLLGKTRDNFFLWRKKFFIDKNERRRGTQNYWPEYEITARGKEALRGMLESCSLTAKKEDVLDLPPLLRLQLYADLSPKQRRHYETMREFLFAVDEQGNELNASNLLTRSLRLQQITAGFLGDVAVGDNNRLEVFDDAIELTQGAQFVVWTIFKASYEQLGKRLADKNISHGFLTGEQSAEERQLVMDDFQSGKIRALIAHPRAGGVGVNLTAAKFSIHYTRNYSLVDDLQAEARNYRGGSEIHDKITRIDIIAANTIDEEITEALRSKKTVQDFILGLKEKHGK